MIFLGVEIFSTIISLSIELAFIDLVFSGKSQNPRLHICIYRSYFSLFSSFGHLLCLPREFLKFIHQVTDLIILICHLYSLLVPILIFTLQFKFFFFVFCFHIISSFVSLPSFQPVLSSGSLVTFHLALHCLENIDQIIVRNFYLMQLEYLGEVCTALRLKGDISISVGCGVFVCLFAFVRTIQSQSSFLSADKENEASLTSPTVPLVMVNFSFSDLGLKIKLVCSSFN